ncbi:IS3 family transposase [Paenibacillus alvei]|uniref:IS3 family transposase n=1 Tax=Paenibacillus alvei TaxID=44250 RepID=UPI0013D97406|nr:IS3 family transposase [Paenibacillus alvei]
MGAAEGGREKRRQTYQAIEALAGDYPVGLLCQLTGVVRSSYYKWTACKRNPTPKQREDQSLKEKILECHTRLKGIYGYPRVCVWLQKTYGLNVNHKRVYRLMKELGIRSRIRRRKPYFGRRESNVLSTNVLNRDFSAVAPNKKWVTDVTYLPIGSRFLYLSVVLDLYNNEVVAFQMSRRNNLKLVLDTVKAAVQKRRVTNLLLHSDQGFQYTHRLYYSFLEHKKMKVSMSRKGNCWDNACIESFFGHLKSECLRLQAFTSEVRLIEAIESYIQFYNHERFQSKLNNLSPVEYRTKTA